MSYRFRRSIRIAPGLRVNLGKTGASLSAGSRGASVTLGRHGLYGNVGLSGTGLSVRQKLSGGPTTRSSSTAGQVANVQVTIGLKDDGSVSITDSAGNALPQALERRIKREKADDVRAWLTGQCERWNQGIDAILGVHLQTPPPTVDPSPSPRPFPEPPPDQPDPRPLDFLARIFGFRRRAIEHENAQANKLYRQTFTDWEQRKAAFHDSETERLQQAAKVAAGEPAAMEQALEQVLRSIEWPRETMAGFSISTDGRVLFLDVDLPEIEHLPSQEATVAASAFRILVRDRSESRRRRDYVTHVHAIAFRTIGEAFACLPTVERVELSGYSQRPNRSTAQVEDHYLLSVRVARHAWQGISFGKLAELDLPACFETFDLRRRMSKTGVFSPVEPFPAPALAVEHGREDNSNI